MCVGVVPCVQSKLSRTLQAHCGKKLLKNLQNLENTTMKRAMVRLRGTREKGVVAFVVYRISQKDTMEGPLWKETSGRSLGSHDTAELVGGMFYGNGCRQRTTRLHAISSTKIGWSSVTHNKALPEALARSLRESKVRFVFEGTRPFRGRAIIEDRTADQTLYEWTPQRRWGHSSTTTLDAK